MSDIERPWVERRESGAPSSCPVCGGATKFLGDSGIITCRAAGPDHFEWHPTPRRVESERVPRCPIDDGSISCTLPADECRCTGGRAIRAAGYSGRIYATTPDGRTDIVADGDQAYRELADALKVVDDTLAKANRRGELREWKCSWCRGHSPADQPRCLYCDAPRPFEGEAIVAKINETSARMRLAAAGLWPARDVFVAPVTFESGATVAADKPQARSEGYTCAHTPPCRDRREVGDPEWTATELACGRAEIEEPDPGDFAAPFRAPCICDRVAEGAASHSRECVANAARLIAEPPPPVEGELLGVDFADTVVRRLHPDAAALASLHRPLWGTPPTCAGCDQGCRCDTAEWPCTTAGLALEMMGLTPSDISITEE